MSQSVVAVCRAVDTFLSGVAGLYGGYGELGLDTPNDSYALTQVRQPVQRPTEGPGRSREKAMELDVVIYAFRSGGQEVQQGAFEAAQGYADQLEAFLRANDGVGTDNARLGGACRDAWISTMTNDPVVVWAADDGDMNDAPIGRAGLATVTVTALVRY